MPAKVYTQKEAKVTPIKKKTLAVIGYGSQGHAHALNLKESGCKVIIGLYKGSKSIRVAKRHGFEVMEVAEASATSITSNPWRFCLLYTSPSPRDS